MTAKMTDDLEEATGRQGRSVLTLIIEKDLLIDEFDNIDQHDVEMGESRSDGALWRGEEAEEGPEEEPGGEPGDDRRRAWR